MKIITKIIAYSILSACLYACTTPDVIFDEKQRIYFLADSMRYSFGTKPLSIITDTVQFPVRIIGSPTKFDREFVVQIDNATATAGKEYKDFSGKCTLLADSVNAYIPIIMYRQTLAKDSTYRISFSFTPNINFQLGVEEALKATVSFNNILEKPEWWDGMEYYLGIYQPEKYQKFIELNDGKEVADSSDFDEKFLQYLKIFYNVKLFFDERPELNIHFPEDVYWPF